MSNTGDLEKSAYLAQLFDLYKNGLTEKQKTYFEYYFFDDLTMQEIADEFGISRAGVMDGLKKACDYLQTSENNFNMYKQNQKIREHLASFETNEIDAKELVSLIEKDLM
jgi:predicted DNA-binding protein YlxM (UPF0122 family)